MKKSSKYILIFLIFLFTFPSYSADTLSAEDYRVYSAVLEQMNVFLKGNVGHIEKINIIYLDTNSKNSEGLIYLLSSHNQADLKEFNLEAKNNLLQSLNSYSFDFSKIKNNNITVLSTFFRKSWYYVRTILYGFNSNIDLFIFSLSNLLSKRFPFDIIISNIGYDNQHKKAILVYAFDCLMCAEFYLVELHKTNTGWIIMKKELIGVS
jgi:hypothetical protein